MPKIADRIVVLWGWRRFLLSLVAGGASALALPPFGAFPLLFLTFPVLIWLLDGATPARSGRFLARVLPPFLVGWSFGFGYFLAGLWWIGAAFLVDADQFAWAMPLAVIALPAGLALLWGLGAAVARLVWPEGWVRIVIFAVCLSGVEWLRGHLLSGFPWNAVGYALTPAPLFMQSASLIGIWGLTLAACLIFAAPALLADAGRPGRGRWVFIGVAILLLAAHVGYGAWRLSSASDATVPDIHLRIVQPAIPQDDKWRPEKGDEILKRYLDLSDGATAPGRTGIASVTHLIWPESAFPFLLTERPEALAAIAALLPDGTTLITGAARRDPSAGDARGAPVFNSVYVIDDKGEIRGAYDKVDLVPFGEFLPFRSLFESLGLRQLIALPGGFAAGTARRTLEVPGAPLMQPLVCYEIIFPGAVIAPGPRPGWLVNVTNDAWYGNTPGPRQHLLQAQVRAVEEGLPIARAANSGISAIIDAYGRITRSLPLGDVGILDGDLPQALVPPLYARFGDLVFLALLGLSLLSAACGQLTSILRRN
ncbi:MAG TPA: apolipoprotein N-acyltransferase [Bauldia sp.]|nr:apolipoprotein N-acyltransferase [Bauldia sp.]